MMELRIVLIKWRFSNISVHASLFDTVILVHGYEQDRERKCSVLKFIAHEKDRQADRQLLYPAGDISVLTGQVTVLYA